MSDNYFECSRPVKLTWPTNMEVCYPGNVKACTNHPTSKEIEM